MAKGKANKNYAKTGWLWLAGSVGFFVLYLLLGLLSHFLIGYSFGMVETIVLYFLETAVLMISIYYFFLASLKQNYSYIFLLLVEAVVIVVLLWLSLLSYNY